MSGYFITVEGNEGVGKTTLSRWLVENLAKQIPEIGNRKVIWTREPGSTVIGEKIRTLLLDNDNKFEPNTEMLLHFASRIEHLKHVVEPALAQDAIVICDRYIDTSFAYQVYAQGASKELFEALCQNLLKPNLVLFLHASSEVVSSRLTLRQPDRYESKGSEFFEKVNDGFLCRFDLSAKERGYSYVPINTSINIEENRERAIRWIKFHLNKS